MAKGAVIARILSQYSDKGTKAAMKDFAKMEKRVTAFAAKSAKAFGIAAAAVGGFAIKVGTDAVKAAMEDQQSQALLANSLRGTVGATQEAIAATEEWISKQQMALGVTDDELRPALGRLAAVTGDISSAQNLLGIALDVSAAKGIDLSTASSAVAKAYGGQMTALKKLFPQISAATVKSKDFRAALVEISDEVGGAAATRADTLAFKMQRVKIALAEASETLGYALLPLVQKFVDFMTKVGIPAMEAFVGVLTGNNSIKAAADKAGMSIAQFRDGGVNPTVYAAMRFAEELRKLAFTLGFTDSTAAGISGQSSGLASILNIFTAITAAIRTVIEWIQKLINAWDVLLDKFTAVANFYTRVGNFLGKIGPNDNFKPAPLNERLADRKKRETDARNRAVDSLRYTAQIPTAQPYDYKKTFADYLKNLGKLSTATEKQTKAMTKQDKITAEAVRLNLLKQAKLGISSPTISLAASAGANGTIGNNTSINNAGVTVNVAGSVISENDLITAVQNGLENLNRRGGGFTRTAASVI